MLPPLLHLLHLWHRYHTTLCRTLPRLHRYLYPHLYQPVDPTLPIAFTDLMLYITNTANATATVARGVTAWRALRTRVDTIGRWTAATMHGLTAGEGEPEGTNPSDDASEDEHRDWAFALHLAWMLLYVYLTEAIR